MWIVFEPFCLAGGRRGGDGGTLNICGLRFPGTADKKNRELKLLHLMKTTDTKGQGLVLCNIEKFNI